MVVFVRPRTAVLVAGCIALVAVRDARAFCRTTSVQIPAGYDPSVAGCWSRGKGLAWATGTVPYALSAAASKQVSLQDATRIAHLAFKAWNDVDCASGTPMVKAYDNGTVSADAARTDCGLSACAATVHDSRHVIVFDDDSWPHNDPANTLALTTVTYGVSSAEIFDADIEINSAEHVLSVQEPPPPGTFDLQAILTHEAGHFYGLAHAPDGAAIMYAYYQPGAVALTTDDTAGLCAIYPHEVAGGGGCASAREHLSSCEGLFGFSVIALLGARRRSAGRRGGQKARSPSP
jgi:hypothetical protein